MQREIKDFRSSILVLNLKIARSKLQTVLVRKEPHDSQIPPAIMLSSFFFSTMVLGLTRSLTELSCKRVSYTLGEGIM